MELPFQDCKTLASLLGVAGLWSLHPAHCSGYLPLYTPPLCIPLPQGGFDHMVCTSYCFSFRITLALPGPLHFHIHFRILLSILENNTPGRGRLGVGLQGDREERVCERQAVGLKRALG